MWSTRRLNDMDPSPWSATPRELTWRDTCAAGEFTIFELSSGVIPERRPPEAPVFGLGAWKSRYRPS
jgi:hypothetical protein